MTNIPKSHTAPPRSPLFVRLRMLPALIIFSLVLLGFKLEHLYQVTQTLSIQSAIASQTTQSQKKSAPSAAPKETNWLSGGKDPSEDFNILNMPPEKIDALRALAKRHEQIVKRENSIVEREAVLEALDKRMAQKEDNMVKIQGYLETLLKEKTKKDKESVQHLVTVYSKMKPADAANILEGIDLNTLIDIMEAMKPATSSAILSKMEPVKARYLTMELAHRTKKHEEEVQKEYTHQVSAPQIKEGHH